MSSCCADDLEQLLEKKKKRENEITKFVKEISSDELLMTFYTCPEQRKKLTDHIKQIKNKKKKAESKLDKINGKISDLQAAAPTTPPVSPAKSRGLIPSVFKRWRAKPRGPAIDVSGAAVRQDPHHEEDDVAGEEPDVFLEDEGSSDNLSMVANYDAQSVALSYEAGDFEAATSSGGDGLALLLSEFGTDDLFDDGLGYSVGCKAEAVGFEDALIVKDAVVKDHVVANELIERAAAADHMYTFTDSEIPVQGEWIEADDVIYDLMEELVFTVCVIGADGFTAGETASTAQEQWSSPRKDTRLAKITEEEEEEGDNTDSSGLILASCEGDAGPASLQDADARSELVDGEHVDGYSCSETDDVKIADNLGIPTNSSSDIRYYDCDPAETENDGVDDKALDTLEQLFINMEFSGDSSEDEAEYFSAEEQ